MPEREHSTILRPLRSSSYLALQPPSESDSSNSAYYGKKKIHTSARGSNGGTGTGSGRYATSPSSTGGIGITRRSSALSNSGNAAAVADSIHATAAEKMMNAAAAVPSMTTSGSHHSALSISSGNAPDGIIHGGSGSATPSKSSVAASASSDARPFLRSDSRSESRAYPAQARRSSDALARLQFLIRTNSKVVAAVVVFAFFVVFVLDDEGGSGGGGGGSSGGGAGIRGSL